MVNPNFVCTVCSQTFTRKWRGMVHNTNMHAGLAKIVRLIDYIIGRSNGEYEPSDPFLYRHKKGKGNLTEHLRESNLRSQASFAGPSISPRQINKEAKQPSFDTNIYQGHYFQPSRTASPPNINQQQYYHSNSNPVSDPTQQYTEAIVKMGQIKKLASKYLSPEEIKQILSGACSYCKITGDNTPLDITLEEVRKKVELKEATDYLNG
jgi:hypothetical protein